MSNNTAIIVLFVSCIIIILLGLAANRELERKMIRILNLYERIIGIVEENRTLIAALRAEQKIKPDNELKVKRKPIVNSDEKIAKQERQYIN